MSKKNWVLIRGLVRGRGHWLDFLSILESAAPGDEIECLDLAGNGERFREVSDLTTAAAARDLRSRSKFVAENKKVRIVGHSLGAMVAVEWARQFPKDIEMLCLMNTSSADLSPPWMRLSPSLLKIIPGLLRTNDAFQQERLVLGLIANNSQRVNELLPRLAAYTALRPVTPINAFRQILAGTTARFPRHMSVPVKILASERDRLVSVENSRRLAARWGVPAHIHPTAGHDLAVDDPRWLVEHLL